jgi:cytochrome b561
MTDRRYTSLAITFHWLVAIGIILNLALTWIWPAVADDQVRPLINLHKSVGITVLGLAIMRLLWRFAHKPPALPAAYKPWEVTLSHWTHIALYVIIFAMPLTGWIMDSAWKDAATHPMFLFGLVEWPRIGFIMALDPATKLAVHDGFGEAHDICGKLVYVLAGLHILGALKHQWLDGTRELQRMWYTGTPE